MAPPATSMADIPDVMLEEISLRLTAADDLARASTTCPSFRRVIADHAFLRRYRTLHPPPLLGLLQGTFSPAEPPHPSAVAARAFLGFDFSCSSFLPSTPGHTWSPVDFFDGRDLLAGAPDKEDSQFWGRDLAVCDPVHRRYILLPAVPDDLKVLAPQPDLFSLETFLAPGQDEDNPLSFRVMCVAQCATKLLLLVFSFLGGQGQWDAHTFDQWSGQAIFASDGSFVNYHGGLSNRQFVHGCFYWHLHFRNKFLVLDVRAMELSAVNLRPELETNSFALVEAAEGMLGLGMLTEGYDKDGDGYWLIYFILRNNQWHVNKVIRLPVYDDAALVGVAGGYLLLEGLYSTTAQETLKFGCFSVDVKTFQVEFFAELSKAFMYGRLYAGFPPSLCAPTI